MSTIHINGLTPSSTPLFDPSLDARQLGLSKATSSESTFNNLNYNPGSIVNTKGISLHASEFQGISYSAVTIVNEINSIFFGINYTGSSIQTINRSIIDNSNKIIEVESIIPYEYHSLTVGTGKNIGHINVGVAFKYKTLVLDDNNIKTLHTIAGVQFSFWNNFTFGTSIIPASINSSQYNALQLKEQIVLCSLNYKPTKRSTIYIGTIENKNEVSTHATFHYSIEHYINDYIPIRIGIDHNRLTFGLGLYLRPLDIDIGWAQSKDPITEDQIIMSFSYSFEEINRLY